jgi:hypothetical protein
VKGTVATVRRGFPAALRMFNWVMTAALLWLTLWLLERSLAEFGGGRHGDGRRARIGDV